MITPGLVGYIAAVVAIITAWLSASVVRKLFLKGIVEQDQRYSAVDGLRGVLALGVMTSHFLLNWNYSLNTQWAPSSNVFLHFGECSVIIFFMITSFLFYGKVLRNSKNLDWSVLYIGRALRIMPMYLVVLSIVVFLSLFEQGFEVRGAIAIPILRWSFFIGMPDINGFKDTFRIIAGVAWTLPYEWCFYAFLPVVAFIFGRLLKKPLFRVIALFVFLVGTFALPDARFAIFRLHMFAPFSIGMIAWEASHSSVLRRWLSSLPFSCVMIGLLTVALSLPGPDLSPIGLLLISVFFIAIVCGNSVFGLLTTKSAVLVGDASYSIYLLHGVILFVLYKAQPQDYTSALWWGILPVATVIVATLSIATHYAIELPFISLARRNARARAGALSVSPVVNG